MDVNRLSWSKSATRGSYTWHALCRGEPHETINHQQSLLWRLVIEYPRFVRNSYRAHGYSVELNVTRCSIFTEMGHYFSNGFKVWPSDTWTSSRWTSDFQHLPRIRPLLLRISQRLEIWQVFLLLQDQTWRAMASERGRSCLFRNFCYCFHVQHYKGEGHAHCTNDG